MEFINISNPITLLLILVLLLFLIFVGKTFNISYLPAVGLFGLLGLLVYYIVSLKNPDLQDSIGTIRNCMAINFVLIFVEFMAYLWVDATEAKVKNKKSYDDSLDWFWEKI